MASRIQELVTRLIAKDDASKVISKVADQMETLETGVQIPVTADDKATGDVRSIIDRLEGLTAEDQQIVLKARATDAQRDIDRLLRSLANVDRMDDKTVKVRVTALGDARAELDRIQDELEKLDRTTVEPEVNIDTKGIDALSDGMAALPGPLGELTSTLGSGGTVVAGVTAIAGGLFAAADSAADMAIAAETMGELTGDSVEDASRLQAVWKTTGADINDLNDVILQINGVLQTTPELAEQLGINLSDGLTGGQRFVQIMEKLRKFTGGAAQKAQLMSQLLGEEGARQGAKLLAVVDDIGASMADIPEGLVITGDDVDQALDMKQAVAEINQQFQALAVELGESIIPLVTDLVELLETAKTPEYLQFASKETGKFSGALEQTKRSLDALLTRDLHGTFVPAFADAGQAASDFEARVAASVGGLDDVARSAEDAGAAAEEALRLQAEEADRAAAKVKALEDSYRALRDELTNRESFLGVQDAFDQVTTSAQEAWEAAKSGADDADAKGRDYERSLIDLKQAVIDYGTEVLKLPASRLTTVLADIDEGSFDEAQTELDELTQDRLVRIWFQTQGPGSSSMGAGPVPGGLTTTSRMVGATASAAPAPITITNNIHTPAIGSEFDFMRIIDKSNRKAARLMPRIP